MGTVSLLLQGTNGPGPEFTSPPFTPAAGHTVLVVYCCGGPGVTAGVSLTAPGYTWNYSPIMISADTDMGQRAAWAFNVPGGAVSFTTVGLGFSGMTYYVLDLGGVNAQDQYGAQLTPFPSSPLAEIPTNGPLAQTGEVAVAWSQSQFTATATAMAGYTTTQQFGNSPINMIVAYNPSVGPAGSPHTGGWSNFTAGGQAQIMTFMGPSGGVGNQPGFPKGGNIEEPSEGMQESNVVPPSMGTIQ